MKIVLFEIFRVLSAQTSSAIKSRVFGYNDMEALNRSRHSVLIVR